MSYSLSQQTQGIGNEGVEVAHLSHLPLSASVSSLLVIDGGTAKKLEQNPFCFHFINPHC